MKAAHFKTDTAHPVIEGPDALADYDAIIVGAPTRYGRMPSQMAAFWDTTGGLWAKGALIGKVGGAFTSTASQHGGQETTLFSIITNLLHHGHDDRRARLRLPGADGRRRGARRIALWRDDDRRRRRQPPADAEELDGARYQGKRIAEMAAKLVAELILRAVRELDRRLRGRRDPLHGCDGLSAAASSAAAEPTGAPAGEAIQGGPMPGRREAARAARNEARRAAPGAAAVAPTQRQCHGSHFTPCLLPAGKLCSKPKRGALATSQL